MALEEHSMSPLTPLEDETWPEEDAGYDTECNVEDIDFDDSPESPGDIEEPDFESPARQRQLTPKQRVELAFEDKWLKSMMADFEDFDDFTQIEGPGDGFAGEQSH
jgi:hypothetical protein